MIYTVLNRKNGYNLIFACLPVESLHTKGPFRWYWRGKLQVEEVSWDPTPLKTVRRSRYVQNGRTEVAVVARGKFFILYVVSICFFLSASINFHTLSTETFDARCLRLSRDRFHLFLAID